MREAIFNNVFKPFDYYPFGMIMPGRAFSTTSSYRFGFNGKEGDNEVEGIGNWQDYGMRMYSPRLGRFPSVDPINIKYPELTPFQFASNNPIEGIDLDGLELYAVIKHLNEKGSVTSINIITCADVNGNLYDMNINVNGIVPPEKDNVIEITIDSKGNDVYKYRSQLDDNENNIENNPNNVTASSKVTQKATDDPKYAPGRTTGINLSFKLGKNTYQGTNFTNEGDNAKSVQGAPPHPPIPERKLINVSIKSKFTGGDYSITNIGELKASAEVNNIIKILKNDPNAKLDLQGNVVANKGTKPGDKSGNPKLTNSQLGIARSNSLRQFFIDAGVNRSQITISAPTYNAKDGFSCKGTLSATTTK